MIGLALARLVALVGLSGEYSSIVLDHLHAFIFLIFLIFANRKRKIQIKLQSDFDYTATS
jgi:hypothetical protein